MVKKYNPAHRRNEDWVENHWAENKNSNEWIVANQQGSFGMGTPGRIPSRKYHCLLISRVGYYDDPHAVVSEVNEIFSSGDGDHELGAFRYDNATYPRGFRLLESFSADPEPVWVYQLGKVRLERRLRLHPTRNVARLIYRVSGLTGPATLRLFPFLLCRNAHALQRENQTLDKHTSQSGPWVTLRPYAGFPELFFHISPSSTFRPESFWNYNVHYLEEHARGYTFREDHFCPGHFLLNLESDGEIALTFGLIGEMNHDGSLENEPPILSGFRQRLEHAASQFLIRRGDGRLSIIAGYPWLGEWTRNAMIALPGLTLACDKPQEALDVLDTFAGRIVRGLLPNELGREPNRDKAFSVDGTLLFIYAIQRVAESLGEEAVHRYDHVVISILKNLLDHGAIAVHVRPEGMLYASSKPRALTWMDAVIDDQPVTPRSPYAVEMNALFYNAMQQGLRILDRQPDSDLQGRLKQLTRQFAINFNTMFWFEEGGYFADSHTGQIQDTSLRPNQLFALMLPYRLVSAEQGRAVLKAVRDKLWTPRGLRSLAPNDPNYIGRYQGGPISRDQAYHQGTVWPWLFGPFVDAVLAIEGETAALNEIDRIFEAMEPHLDDCGLGMISEIFDGDAPHTPRGCPAQSWSVAELLRLDRLRTTLQGRKAPTKRKVSPARSKPSAVKSTNQKKAKQTRTASTKKAKATKTSAKKPKS